jgi:hypothetical protein
VVAVVLLGLLTPQQEIITALLVGLVVVHTGTQALVQAVQGTLHQLLQAKETMAVHTLLLALVMQLLVAVVGLVGLGVALQELLFPEAVRLAVLVKLLHYLALL